MKAFEQDGAELTRRAAFQRATRGAAWIAGAGVADTMLSGSLLSAGEAKKSDDSEFVIQRGRIRQSVMGWCFQPMKAEVLAEHCKKIGMVAIEGIPRESYAAVRKLGLEISLVSSHGFAEGPCDPKFRDQAAQRRLADEALERIEAADPSTNKKYTQWMARQYALGNELPARADPPPRR